MPMHRRGGQTVGDHYRQIETARMSRGVVAQRLRRFVIQATAQSGRCR